MLVIPHLSRVHELIYELPTERVMQADVITVSPDITMGQLKEVLRLNRISGTPVVEHGHLVGIVSIENLIRSLEAGDTGSLVRDKMTRKLVTVRAQDSVIEAVKKFAHHSVGRLPVVDDQGHLVGILTAGDITRGLLEAIGLNTLQQETSASEGPSPLEEIVPEHAELSLWYQVKAHDFKGGGSASSKLKRVLCCLGAPPQVVRRAAIAAYEAEMNLIIHTEEGGDLIAVIEAQRLKVSALDRGPGIADLDAVMRPGFSTAPAWIRELGFGAGMGLANIQRCADTMKLESQVGVGTRLEMTFLLHPESASVDGPRGSSECNDAVPEAGR